MHKLLKIVTRLFVISYYSINAGFFLFFFVLFFGVVHAGQLLQYHIALIIGILHVKAFLTIVLLFWMLYNYKCLAHNLRILESPEGAFLFECQALPFSKTLMLFLFCQFLQYLPILLYSVFVVLFAFKESFPFLAWLIIIFQLSMPLLAALYACYRINIEPFRSERKPPFRIRLFRPRTRIFSLYLFYYSLESRKLVWLVIKAASLFILNIFLVMNKEDFQDRNFILIFQVIQILHVVLFYYYVMFMETRLAFSRNLPIPPYHRLLSFAIMYMILFLPEFVYMLLNRGNGNPMLPAFIFFGLSISQSLLMTAILYALQLNSRSYMQVCFGFYFFISMALLSGHPMLVLIAEMILAISIFYARYYRFEIDNSG